MKPGVCSRPPQQQAWPLAKMGSFRGLFSSQVVPCKLPPTVLGCIIAQIKPTKTAFIPLGARHRVAAEHHRAGTVMRYRSYSTTCVPLYTEIAGRILFKHAQGSDASKHTPLMLDFASSALHCARTGACQCAETYILMSISTLKLRSACGQAH